MISRIARVELGTTYYFKVGDGIKLQNCIIFVIDILGTKANMCTIQFMSWPYLTRTPFLVQSSVNQSLSVKNKVMLSSEEPTGKTLVMPSLINFGISWHGFLWYFCPSEILSYVIYCIWVECSDTNVYDPASHGLRVIPPLFVYTIPEESDRPSGAFCRRILSDDTSG